MPSPIIPFLSQGAMPIEGDAVAKGGYRVLVLCAEEYQPPAANFPGLEDVLYAPNDDSGAPFTALQQVIATMAAHRVADYVRRRKHVLVTCAMGKNRSGLVTALALHFVSGKSGRECVAHVRRKRPIALSNEDFVCYLEKLPPRRLARTG